MSRRLLERRLLDRGVLDRRLLDRIAIHALLGVTVALYLWVAVHLA